MKVIDCSTRSVGKTLDSWNKFIKQINDIKVQYEDYVLYINKDYYKQYKEKLNFIDIEIVITDNLPKNINAIFMKKTDWWWNNANITN